MNSSPINRFEISRLSEEDGGGWIVTFPELPGCTSDGDTIDEAVKNAADAEKAWLAAKEQWSVSENPKISQQMQLVL